MNFMHAIDYPFSQKDIVGKLLYAAFFVFCPIINLVGGFILLGYGVKVLAVASDYEADLPEFDPLDDLLMGFIVAVSAVAHMLPVFLLAAGIGVITNSDEKILAIAMPVIIVLGILVGLVYAVGVIRFAVSGEGSRLFDIAENARLVFQNPTTMLMFVLQFVLLQIALAIGIMLGFMLLVIPGIILSIAGNVYSQPYLMSQLGRQLGLMEKAKQKRKVKAY